MLRSDLIAEIPQNEYHLYDYCTKLIIIFYKYIQIMHVNILNNTGRYIIEIHNLRW